MVSPRKQRLVADLVDGSEAAYRPSLDDGTVVYPTVERVLGSDDEPARDALESLAERDILRREFEGKVYLCPDCGTEEMTYTTACPDCGATHIVEREFLTCEGCERTAPAAAFERDDNEIVCHDCDSTMSADEVDRTRQYVCQECDQRTDSPLHALECTGDGFTCYPTEAVEHALYRYDLGSAGEPWLDAQMRARKTVADAFDDRGYDVEEDATVTGASGTERYLHVYAADDLLDERIAAAIHELPLADDIAALQETAADLDARPVLVSTVGTVSAEVAARAEQDGVTVLAVTDDGAISRDYDVTEDLRDDPSLLKRITTALM